MIIKGKVHKFGNDINTDDIISAKYLVTTDPKELGKYCLEVIDNNFAKKIEKYKHDLGIEKEALKHDLQKQILQYQ